MNPVLPLIAAILAVAPALDAAEPFLKPNDVIALVGGEDMVAASEYGYLELLLQRALPEYHLKVRSLAWEGDTVFEQPRDLNYPTLEAQLDEVGATVVIVQFGQMESLAGTSKLPEFIKAYEKLIERVGAGKRRVVPIIPALQGEAGTAYAEAIRSLQPAAMRAQPGGLTDISPGLQPGVSGSKRMRPEGAPERSAAPAGADAKTNDDPRVSPGANLRQPSGLETSRDGVHFSFAEHQRTAHAVAATLSGTSDDRGFIDEHLRQIIAAKNRLWFHYYRPQNWAFLAGDRTEQPSSRDWKDPSKRWFPEEMKQWLPLIDAKEKEIWALAAKAAKP
ncbi:MAG: hypothetical protein ABMA13_23310 [Chthoniobacteraceae bacterium]